MDTVVKLRDGVLRGRVVNGVHVFKGVPYADPPTGVNHLRLPQRHSGWDGVREALEFGPKPPQPPMPPQVTELLPETPGRGDNCLTLNIWSPDTGAAARCPVMVWIPGGMYEYHGTSACPFYDGSRFARDGIVCVTINYRVGAEGFLYLGDDIANCGLLDQIAALEWVRENIAAFGGDPGNVTVFGESAGALSIGTLLSMPRARGLFARAILQSGAAHHVSSTATAKRIGERFAQRLGVPPKRESIANLLPEHILEAQLALRIELATQPDPEFWGEVALTNLPWQPVVDGSVVPGRPIDRIATGVGGDIDLIVGTNVDENRLFLVPSGEIDRISNEMLIAVVTAYGLPAVKTVAAYRERNPNGTPGDLMAAIQGDWYWRLPAIRLADARARQVNAADTFMYEFAWRSPQFGGRLGACHSLEIPFAFDTLGLATAPLAGTNPPQPLADLMHAAWVSFARTGDPGWPTYKLDSRATMHFDDISSVVSDPRSVERALWDNVR